MGNPYITTLEFLHYSCNFFFISLKISSKKPRLGGEAGGLDYKEIPEKTFCKKLFDLPK